MNARADMRDFFQHDRDNPHQGLLDMLDRAMVADTATAATETILTRTLRESFDYRVRAELAEAHHREHLATEEKLRSQIESLEERLRISEEQRLRAERTVNSFRIIESLYKEAAPVLNKARTLNLELSAWKSRDIGVKHLMHALRRVFDPRHDGPTVLDRPKNGQ